MKYEDKDIQSYADKRVNELSQELVHKADGLRGIPSNQKVLIVCTAMLVERLECLADILGDNGDKS